MKNRVGILISGRGSNMMALVEAARAPRYPAQVAVVIANRPGAAGIIYARAHGLPTVVIDHKTYATRTSFEEKLHETLVDYRVDVVALCGFMRLLTPDFVDIWRNRMLNIHPSLLPAYKGLHTHERALADGVRIAGCTVHVVRAEMDVGPVIAQAAVAVLEGDTVETLRARVLAAEHLLYPHALALFASGRARVEGELVALTGATQDAPPALIWPPVA